MKLVLFLISMFFSFSTMAQDIVLPPECSILKDHLAADDVTYRAGQDVNGNSVVPADLNAPVIDLPETFIVPLTVDVAKNLGNAAANGIEGQGTLGFLEISKNGRVMYNGADVTPQVYTLCGQKLPQNAAPIVVMNNGQKQPDIIELPQIETIDKPLAKLVVAPIKPSLGELIEGGEFKD